MKYLKLILFLIIFFFFLDFCFSIENDFYLKFGKENLLKINLKKNSKNKIYFEKYLKTYFYCFEKYFKLEKNEKKKFETSISISNNYLKNGNLINSLKWAEISLNLNKKSNEAYLIYENILKKIKNLELN